jgi:hypothetical protein
MDMELTDAVDRQRDIELFASMQQILNVLADKIRFDVDFITNPTSAQIRVLQSIRDNGDGKSTAPAIVDRQTDAIHGDGTLAHEQWSHYGGDGKADDGKLAFCAHG